MLINISMSYFMPYCGRVLIFSHPNAYQTPSSNHRVTTWKTFHAHVTEHIHVTNSFYNILVDLNSTF